MADIAKLVGLDKLINNIDVAVLTALDEGAIALADAIREEIPKGAGTAADSVYIVPARREGFKYISSVVIGDKEPVNNYIWALWKGYEADYSGHPMMHFINWENGPDELRGKDGYFHFTRVHHKVPENQFVERALNKSTRGILNKIKSTIIQVLVGKQ